MPVSITVVGNPVRGDYIQTNGQTLSGIAAPYVAEYANENDIDLPRLSASLFPSGFPKAPASGETAVLIGSYKYRTHNWSYFQGPTVVLYDLLKIRGAGIENPMLLVLYNRVNPDAIIIDRFEADWHLALVSTTYKILSDALFNTRIKHQEKGLWDMIYTDLSVERGSPFVRIMYTHTGGGGGRDQEFTFSFVIERPPVRLKLRRAKQTLDEYQP